MQFKTQFNCLKTEKLRQPARNVPHFDEIDKCSSGSRIQGSLFYSRSDCHLSLVPLCDWFGYNYFLVLRNFVPVGIILGTAHNKLNHIIK